jgi:putative FmdB family regulatory protein
MPLYEYECTACHRRIEKIKTSFNAAPETICPFCGGALEQSLSAPAVQFKGSGFYTTDYAKSGSGAPKSSEGSSDSPKDSPKENGSKTDVAASAEKPSSTAPAKSEAAPAAPAPAKSE